MVGAVIWHLLITLSLLGLLTTVVVVQSVGLARRAFAPRATTAPARAVVRTPQPV